MEIIILQAYVAHVSVTTSGYFIFYDYLNVVLLSFYIQFDTVTVNHAWLL